MKDSTRPIKINKPGAIFGIVVTSCLIIFMFWQMAQGFSYYKDLKVYNQRGVRMYAHVDGYDTKDCGKHGCSIYVKYFFSAPTRPGGLLKQFSRMNYLCRDKDPENNDDYKFTEATHTAPIVYDPKNPSKSTLNFRNIVFTRTPERYLSVLMALLAIIILILSSMIAGSVWLIRKYCDNN